MIYLRPLLTLHFYYTYFLRENFSLKPRTFSPFNYQLNHYLSEIIQCKTSCRDSDLSSATLQPLLHELVDPSSQMTIRWKVIIFCPLYNPFKDYTLGTQTRTLLTHYHSFTSFICFIKCKILHTRDLLGFQYKSPNC